MVRARKSGNNRLKASPGTQGSGDVSPSRSDPEPARHARRMRKKELSRDEIIAAARRVLLKRGLNATTLDAVAAECGMSKATLYYYYPSKDALMFELVHGIFEKGARTVAASVEKSGSGGEALRAIIRDTIHQFSGNLDDFRLVFMHGQIAGQGAVHLKEEQFRRIRPLNDLWFAGATEKLAAERKGRPPRARLEPRLLAFLAYISAIGMMTMKGMVESLEDPLIYSDEQLIDGLARVFEAAASA